MLYIYIRYFRASTGKEEVHRLLETKERLLYAPRVIKYETRVNTSSYYWPSLVYLLGSVLIT
jgi:hypothetical protein